MSLRNQYCPSSFLISILIVASTTLGNTRILTKQTSSKNSSSIAAAFIFGDSTVDPGNNDFITTLFRSDFPPYGIDFPDQASTGRFTNGRLPTDLIASYVGVKENIPAYLDPTLSLEDLMTGVSFASAGTGYDPSTAERNKVINLATQLQYFEEYKRKLEKLIGKDKMEYNIEHSVFILSCGSNDIIYTYGPDFLPLQPDKVSSYLHLMINQSKSFLEGLLEKGARRIGVVSLPPVGCLPIMMTLHTPLHHPRTCIESISSIASEFNNILKHELNIMQASQPTSSTIIVYADIYGPLLDQFLYPNKYGFEVSDRGCCGSGLIEGALACNSLSPICDDRSKYVFWDAIHPTERSYNFVIQALRPVIDDVIRKIT